MNAAFWVLLLTVIALAAYIYYRPVEVVVERPVVIQDVNWIPWNWGGGGWGWPGSFYVSRPMPHFYSHGGSPGGGPWPRRSGGSGAQPGVGRDGGH